MQIYILKRPPLHGVRLCLAFLRSCFLFAFSHSMPYCAVLDQLTYPLLYLSSLAKQCLFASLLSCSVFLLVGTHGRFLHTFLSVKWKMLGMSFSKHVQHTKQNARKHHTLMHPHRYTRNARHSRTNGEQRQL